MRPLKDSCRATEFASVPGAGQAKLILCNRAIFSPSPAIVAVPLKDINRDFVPQLPAQRDQHRNGSKGKSGIVLNVLRFQLRLQGGAKFAPDLIAGEVEEGSAFALQGRQVDQHAWQARRVEGMQSRANIARWNIDRLPADRSAQLNDSRPMVRAIRRQSGNPFFVLAFECPQQRSGVVLRPHVVN